MAARDEIKSGPALVLAKIESTYGTDAVCAGTDAVFVQDFTISKKFEEVDRPRKRNTYTATGKAIGKVYYEIEAVLPAAGPDDPAAGALEEPEVLRFLQASGWQFASTGGPPVDTHTITQDSGQQYGLTIEAYFLDDDGTCECWKATGCVFSWSANFPGGAEGSWTFSGRGLYNAPTNPALPGGIAFMHPTDETVPRGHTITFDGRSDNIDEWSVSCDHAIQMVGDQGDTYGVGSFYLDLAPPVFSVDPTWVVTSTYDRDAKVLAHDLDALSFTVNTVGGARYVFAASETQQGAFELDKQEAVIRLNQSLYPRDTAAGSGDDALTITITYP